jgi:hypothetical protein
MKLSPRIKEQKAMMESALQKLSDLEAIERLFDFDQTYKKIAQEKVISEYADIMGDLKNDLNTIFKFQPAAS